jgi:hypothetical protein
VIDENGVDEDDGGLGRSKYSTESKTLTSWQGAPFVCSGEANKHLVVQGYSGVAIELTTNKTPIPPPRFADMIKLPLDTKAVFEGFCFSTSI